MGKAERFEYTVILIFMTVAMTLFAVCSSLDRKSYNDLRSDCIRLGYGYRDANGDFVLKEKAE